MTFLVLSRTGRDFRVIGRGTDAGEMTTLAEQAIREARSAETMVIPLEAHFTETGHRWINPDSARRAPEEPAGVHARLNPASGPQPQDDRASSRDETDFYKERALSTDAFGGKPIAIGQTLGAASPEGPDHPGPQSQGSADPAASGASLAPPPPPPLDPEAHKTSENGEEPKEAPPGSSLEASASA